MSKKKIFTKITRKSIYKKMNDILHLLFIIIIEKT